MNYYKVTGQINDSTGLKRKFETEHNFESDKDAYIYASGFARGYAVAHGGTVLDKQIEKLNDDRT